MDLIRDSTINNMKEFQRLTFSVVMQGRMSPQIVFFDLMIPIHH